MNPRLNERARKLLTYVFALIIGIYILFPFLYVLSSSVQPHVELVASETIIPRTITLKNYMTLLLGKVEESNPLAATIKIFPYSLRNSVIVAIVVTLVCLASGSFSAYSFTRLRFRGRDTLFLFILFSRMVPGVAILIPIFVIMNNLGLINTPFSLMITYISFTLPFTIWMLRAYFQAIPRDVEDAALVDGCSRIGVIFRIILPLAAPGLAVTGIFVFMQSWNEFFFALVLTHTKDAVTAPVVASMFITEFFIDYGLLNTATVLVALPPLVLAMIFQKYIVKGLTLGWGK